MPHLVNLTPRPVRLAGLPELPPSGKCAVVDAEPDGWPYVLGLPGRAADVVYVALPAVALVAAECGRPDVATEAEGRLLFPEPERWGLDPAAVERTVST